MTRFAVQYLSEEFNGVSTAETAFVSAATVDAAKDIVIERAGAFINILSVDVSTEGDNRPGLIKTMELASTVVVKPEKPVVAKVRSTVQAAVGAAIADMDSAQLTKLMKSPLSALAKEAKAKAKTVPAAGEKKVTASSRVRERIVIAQAAGLTLEQSCDDIVLWCMTNLSMGKGTARGYVTSQWIRVK